MSTSFRTCSIRTSLTRLVYFHTTKIFAPTVQKQTRYCSDRSRSRLDVVMGGTQPGAGVDASPPDSSLHCGFDAFPKDRINLAEGEDENMIIEKLTPLLADDAHKHRWHLCLDGKGIRRSFHFKTFKQTWSFMQAIAEKCKSERHHPEWWNVCLKKAIFYFVCQSNLIRRHTIKHTSNGQRTGLR